MIIVFRSGHSSTPAGCSVTEIADLKWSQQISTTRAAKGKFVKRLTVRRTDARTLERSFGRPVSQYPMLRSFIEFAIGILSELGNLVP